MFGRIASAALLAVVLLNTSAMADEISLDDFGMSKDGVYYSTRTGLPYFVPADAIQSANIQDLFPELPEYLVRTWSIFFKLLETRPQEEMPQRPTYSEIRAEVEANERNAHFSEEQVDDFTQLILKKTDEAEDNRDRYFPDFNKPAGCDLTSKHSGSGLSHRPDDWEETAHALEADAVVLLMVEIEKTVPTLQVGHPEAALDLVHAKIVEIIRGGESGLRLGDRIMFARYGGPVEVLGVRYCRSPYVKEARFVRGDVALVAGWSHCDDNTKVWCDSGAYPIVDGALHPYIPELFLPVPLSVVREMGSRPGAE